MVKLKVGILRETKNPPDRRVALTPSQIVNLQQKYPDIEFYVQPSDIRCYNDSEYEYLDIPLKEDLSSCDILMGVKEVDKPYFIANKTYIFFSHVAKKQPYNREMLKVIVDKKVTLIDYEYLTLASGARIVAFGRWAGIVGAYKGLRARGIRTDHFNLKQAYKCHDLDEMWAGLKKISLKPGLKILVTGEGRVAHGAMETINQMDLKHVSPEDFLNKQHEEAVVCQIGPQHYTKHKDGLEFDFNNFIKNPQDYESAFNPYTKVTDIFIACHFWDPKSPVFFTKEEMKEDDFKISVIADVSCDIDGPIPSTIRATTIADPFYGYNRITEREEEAFTNPENITVMSVDNLPGELPRDASSDFGNQLIDNVLNHLFTDLEDPIITRAKIVKDGKLTERYAYLKDYLEGKE